MKELAARLIALDPLVWVYAILLGLAFVFSVYGLVRDRGLAGLLAMLLASLAAGAGVARQVGTESAIDRELASRTPFLTRAEVEHVRRDALRRKRALARNRAVASLVPLLLGALAAWRRPVGSRVLVGGFLAIGAVAALCGSIISSRPLPIDRYAFADDDEDAWQHAAAVDRVHDAAPGDLMDGVLCRALGDSRSAFKETGRAIPPVLEEAGQAAAKRCGEP